MYMSVQCLYIYIHIYIYIYTCRFTRQPVCVYLGISFLYKCLGVCGHRVSPPNTQVGTNSNGSFNPNLNLYPEIWVFRFGEFLGGALSVEIPRSTRSHPIRKNSMSPVWQFSLEIPPLLPPISNAMANSKFVLSRGTNSNVKFGPVWICTDESGWFVLACFGGEHF